MIVIHGSGGNGVGKNAYECSICGNVDFWTEEHSYIERPVGIGYKGYEIYFYACSKNCRNSDYEKKYVDWLSKHSGWTKKSALINFQQLKKG